MIAAQIRIYDRDRATHYERVMRKPDADGIAEAAAYEFSGSADIIGSQ